MQKPPQYRKCATEAQKPNLLFPSPIYMGLPYQIYKYFCQFHTGYAIYLLGVLLFIAYFEGTYPPKDFNTEANFGHLTVQMLLTFYLASLIPNKNMLESLCLHTNLGNRSNVPCYMHKCEQ